MPNYKLYKENDLYYLAKDTKDNNNYQRRHEHENLLPSQYSPNGDYNNSQINLNLVDEINKQSEDNGSDISSVTGSVLDTDRGKENYYFFNLQKFIWYLNYFRLRGGR